MPHTIESRSLDIMAVASHDFWVLRDGRGKALAELHGLATDRRSGQAVPIGTDEVNGGGSVHSNKASPNQEAMAEIQPNPFSMGSPTRG